MIGLNVGSGQRPFDRSQGWANLDINPKWKPDLVGDWNNLSMFENASVDYVVAHHTIEHEPCGGAQGFFKESNRVLKHGGSLIITIPNLQTLAQWWLAGKIDDYVYIVNLMGAYMDSEADRHKWHYTENSLRQSLMDAATWERIKPFDWRTIPGADIAKDFWILGMEAVK